MIRWHVKNPGSGWVGSARPGLGVVAAVLLALPAGCGERAPSDGGPLRVLEVYGEPGRQPGQFSYPRAIDAWGDSLVVIDRTARVQRIDAESGRILGWFRMPDWKRGKPTGVTIGPTAEGEPAIYVPDTHYHRVMVFPLPDGHVEAPDPILSFGEYGTESGQFVYPTDVAVFEDERGRAERIYVSEYGGNDRVSVFDAAGAFLFSFGSFGTPGDEGIRFNRPQAIGLDAARGELVVVDACNHRLGRFTLDGELLRWIGGPGDRPGEFNYPYGVCVLEDGEVLVAEFGGNRVQRIDMESGESPGIYGEGGRGPGQLLSPWAVTVLGDRAFVLDSGHDRVVAFRSPGDRLWAAGGGG